MKLSICIPTFNRSKFIGATLNTIVPQLTMDTELVIVDGSPSEDTTKIVKKFQEDNPNKIRYFHFNKNRGFDFDLDCAVELSKGEYCWLMSDDDLVKSNTIETILKALAIQSWGAIVLNYSVHTVAYERLIAERKIPINHDKSYSGEQIDEFFTISAAALSYFGALVIRRATWLSSDRKTYFGSYFVHLGVLFQQIPGENYLLLSEPLIMIRYGNAQWTHKSFEIWMLKWPEIIWNARGVSSGAKLAVCPQWPLNNLKRLATLRALGAYSLKEYRQFLALKRDNIMHLFKAYLLAMCPGFIVNTFAIIFYRFCRQDKIMLMDLLQSRYCVLRKL